MALSDPRYKILPLRGTFAALNGEVANIVEGEICYATDQDQYYQKEGGVLVAVGATKAQGILADTATQPGDNVSTLANDAGYITAADIPGDVVTSVNTQTGDVVLDADDISDASTTNKYTTQARLDKVDGIEDGATADQTPAEIKAAYESNADTNAFTDAEQSKLGGIAAGAEVNVNADWNASSGDAEILNKPTLGTAAAADTTDFATAAQGVAADTAIQPGDNISELNNDAGYITSAGAPGTDLSYDAATRVLASSTGTDATLPEVVASGDPGLITGADKAKLDNIESGATGDQTASEIKIAYESNADTNAFTDAEQAKLAGIEAGAQVNTVDSVAGKTGDVTLAKGDVGLGNVDNTSDTDKPISTATQSALDLKADLVGGVVPNSQLPSLAVSEYLGTVANETELLSLTGQRGDWAIRTDTGSTWVITTDGGSNLSDWTELATPADAVTSVNGFTGAVVLSASDVGAIPSTELPNLAPSTIDLQAVTDNGSTTTNTIDINNSNLILAANGQITTTGNVNCGATVRAGDYDEGSTTNNGVRLRGGSGQVEIQRDSTETGSAIKILQGTDQNVNIDANGDAYFLGELGVGTNSPQGELHVLSDSTARFFLEDGNGRNELRASNGNLTFFANQNANASGLGRTIFYRNGNNETMRLDEDGNAGIGTSSPKSKLHTVGSRDYVGTTPNHNEYDVNFQSGTAIVSIGQSNGIPSIQGHGTGTGYNLALAPNAGRVGVGTTSPEAALHVAGTTQEVLKLSTTAVNAKLYFESSGSTSTNYIQNTADELLVISKGAERVRIDTNGNVGIGTSIPEAALHVTSSINESLLKLKGKLRKNVYLDIDADADRRASIRFLSASSTKWSIGRGDSDELDPSSFHISTASSGGNNAKLVVSADGNVGISTTSMDGQLEVRGDNSLGIISRSTASQVTDTNKAYRARNNSDTDTFSVSYKGQGYFAGNLGIGTSSPSELLEVSGTAPRIRISDNNSLAATATNYLEFYGTDARAAIIFTNSDGLSFRADTAGGGNLVFLTDGGNERMRISADGNVGIGFDTPTEKLVVRGNIVAAETGAGQIKLAPAVDATGSMIRFGGSSGSGAEPRILRFVTAGDQERMRIDAAGNLVIGGTTAGAKLDVRGDVLIQADDKQGGALRIEADQTNPDSDFYYAQEIASSLTGTSATTGDREQGGLFIDVNSHTTGGDTSNEHRAYGIYVDLDSDGDSDVVTGVFADATATPTVGATSVVAGGHFVGRDAGGDGQVANVYGVRGLAQVANSDSDTDALYGGWFRAQNFAGAGFTGAAYGVYSEVLVQGSDDVVGPSYGVRSRIDNATGVEQTNTSYLFHGAYVGVLPTTAWGVYIDGDIPNYFGGEILANSGIKITGTYAEAGQSAEIVVEGSGPIIKLNDTTDDEDFYIHVNQGSFYVLADRDDDGGAFEGPHPLQLKADVNEAYAFGNEIWTAGNDGSGSGLDADQLDGLEGSHYLDYNNLNNTPTLGTAAATAATDYATAVQGATADSAVQPGDLATVATSGSYNDLSNKPTIPTNTNQLTNGSGFLSENASTSYNGTYPLAVITNEQAYTAPSAGAVEITGSTGQITTPNHGNSSEWNTAYGWGDHAAAGYASSAQGAAADSAVQPGDLATVATSGSYNDLTDKPSTPDYVTGVFTPTWVVSSGTTPTAGTATGTYTKIGDRVMFDLEIDTVDVANQSASVTVRIGGLPFTSAGKAAVTIGSIVNFDDSMRTKAYIDSGVTEITLVRNNSNANNETVFTTNNLNQGTGTKNIILLSGTYRV